MDKKPHILTLNRSNTASHETALLQCREALETGGVVIVPTDTVYGIACLADRAGAIRRIFEIKNRPLDRPIALLVSSVKSPVDYGMQKDSLFAALSAYWPGPITFAAPTSMKLEEGVRGEDNTVGIRSPNHSWLQQLLSSLPAPLAATSANLSGLPEAHSVGEMDKRMLTSVDLVIDGGIIADPVPSTVVMKRESEWTIIREGAIPRDVLERDIRSVHSQFD